MFELVDVGLPNSFVVEVVIVLVALLWNITLLAEGFLLGWQVAFLVLLGLVQFENDSASGSFGMKHKDRLAIIVHYSLIKQLVGHPSPWPSP